MGKRNLYLKTIPVEEAKTIYQEALEKIWKTKYEMIPVQEALGRVTKTAVYAKNSSPLYNASAMDGIAVIASHTAGASEKNPVRLKEDVDFVVVDTGDPIHYPYDAVIMAEDLLETESEEQVDIVESAAAWQHVRPLGEDIVAGEMILPGGHQIRSIDVGVLLSAGILELEVVKKPVVAIFPTGTEIIEPGAEIKEGSIIESNSRMFENMVQEQGAIAKRYPILEDVYEVIRDQVKAAVQCSDMVIINAGSSAGRDDYTVHVLRELGEVLVHGVAIKPGKPVILAIVEGKPVIGLPGYPVSAYIAFENFVAPVLAMMGKREIHEDYQAKAVVSKRLVSSLKHKEYVRIKTGVVDGKMIAAPLARGAGAAMSLVRADGFCIIDQNCEGIDAGEEVLVSLYRNPEEIEKTVVITGSHDLILDVAADLCSQQFLGTHLSSTHVGSMGGLMALKRGEAHVAPIHLLDENTGVYNDSYVRNLFREKIAIVTGVSRIQGIMVKKGNPCGIRDIHDLKKVRFVNRQRGAGTRLLFDYLLKKETIATDEINGYDREASTHMAVAALVASDSADAGMGVYSAAKAMDLDFIPVGNEWYEFAIPERFLLLPHVQAFLEVLRGEAFKEKVNLLGGYGTERIGEVRWIGLEE
ncbi:MAG: molybdopterin biosynthesis protein [Anaerostipes sp.]|nr:molybdopterin biosynthesis protein [Anaerostipes sp.]